MLQLIYNIKGEINEEEDIPEIIKEKLKLYKNNEEEKNKAKKPKEKKVYPLDFIMQLKEKKIANEELLLSKDVLEHFEKFKKENVEIKN